MKTHFLWASVLWPLSKLSWSASECVTSASVPAQHLGTMVWHQVPIQAKCIWVPYVLTAREAVQPPVHSSETCRDTVLSVFFLPSASLCCCLVLVFVFRVTSWLCQAKERPDWDRSWSPEAALLTSPTIALVWVRCGFKNPKWNDLNEAVHFSPICKSGIMRPHQSGPGSLCLSVSYVWLPPPRPPRGLRW